MLTAAPSTAPVRHTVNALVKVLADWGYACEVPEDEDAAWAAVRGDAAPTAVVADWHTDILDCGDFFRKVRRAGKHGKCGQRPPAGIGAGIFTGTGQALL